MATVRQAKQQLRSSIKSILQQLSKADIERQSNEVFRTLLGLRKYREASHISVYLSMPGGEIITNSIVKHALNDGKKVFVPYIHALAGERSKVMNMVALRSLEDFENACANRDAWGIPTLEKASISSRERVLRGLEDSRDCAGTLSRLDMMLLPGLCFDEHLHRLGHGKGYYDFFLTRYRTDHVEAGKDSSIEQHSMPSLYGLALKEQVLRGGEVVPTDGSDSTIDALIHEGSTSTDSSQSMKIDP